MKLNQGFRHTLQVAARKAFRIHLSDRTGGGPAQELRIYLGQESQSITRARSPRPLHGSSVNLQFCPAASSLRPRAPSGAMCLDVVLWERRYLESADQPLPPGNDGLKPDHLGGAG